MDVVRCASRAGRERRRWRPGRSTAPWRMSVALSGARTCRRKRRGKVLVRELCQRHSAWSGRGAPLSVWFGLLQRARSWSRRRWRPGARAALFRRSSAWSRTERWPAATTCVWPWLRAMRCDGPPQLCKPGGSRGCFSAVIPFTARIPRRQRGGYNLHVVACGADSGCDVTSECDALAAVGNGSCDREVLPKRRMR